VQNDLHHLETFAQIPTISLDLYNVFHFLAFCRWHTFSFINESKQKLMKTTAFVLILFCLASFTSCTKSNNTDSTEAAEDQNEEKLEDTKLEDDAEFAVSAADAGMMEVQLGSLALSKASSAKIKEFAQTMIDDHTKASEELKALAQTKNITLPAALSDKHQRKYNEMAEKSGAEFDKEYCDLMVKDHKDAVDLFKKAADKSKDTELKAWASEKLPTLEHHLGMAEAMKESVK